MTNSRLLMLICSLLLSSSLLAGPEDWTLNEQDFANSMTYTVQLGLPVGIVPDSEDMLAAFVGSECRGVVKPIRLENDEAFFFLLLIYSNETAGEEVIFRYFNAEDNEVFELSGAYNFVSEQVVGTFGAPVLIDVPNPVITNTQNDRMDKFTIYPVPATNQLTIQKSTQGLHARIMIVDIRGRLLLNRSIVDDRQSETIDVSNFRPGVYTLIYLDEKQSLNRQFIKQ
ncbi:MAG: T9SS type A sorting domain-containing protein [Bacteroidota bacterium]